jgi:hypothetical protein
MLTEPAPQDFCLLAGMGRAAAQGLGCRGLGQQHCSHRAIHRAGHGLGVAAGLHAPGHHALDRAPLAARPGVDHLQVEVALSR